MTLSSEIEALVREAGFEQVGFAELTRPTSIDIYEAWLTKGFNGEMDYLRRHLDEKTTPQILMKRARSAIVVTKNYVPHPEMKTNFPLRTFNGIARYARGRDYHHFLQKALDDVIERLREICPEDEFVAFTDSKPVLERDLAARAGLGWIGKNTCLLSRAQGSLFFIAEIYTTLAPPTAALDLHSPTASTAPAPGMTPDHCGTCTRCIDACPTGALVAPRELDARKCISYLTIESRKIPDERLRAKVGEWLFGCDICQTVCPWNIRLAKTVAALKPEGGIEDERRRNRTLLLEDLDYLLSSSNRTLERDFAGTALARAGGRGLKRNALVVAANARAIELKTIISSLVSDKTLGDLATWALGRLEEPLLTESVPRV